MALTTVAQIISAILALMQVGEQGYAIAQQLGAIGQAALADGRTDLTPDEMAQCSAMDDAARLALQAAIDKAPAT